MIINYMSLLSQLSLCKRFYIMLNSQPKYISPCDSDRGAQGVPKHIFEGCSATPAHPSGPTPDPKTEQSGKSNQKYSIINNQNKVSNV